MSAATTQTDEFDTRPVLIGLLVGCWVLAWALFGNFVRPVGHLAALWPANAMLLGLFIRFPATANRYAWIAATLGFVLADSLYGAWLPTTLALTAGNLASIVPAYLLLRRLPEDDQRLRHPRSVLFLVCVAAGGAACSGVTGAIIDPLLFGGTPWGGWTFWFISELVNYLAITPVILTLPDGWVRNLWRLHLSRISPLKLLPVVALIVSCIASVLIGGPGAVTYPVLPLLWCAISFGLFTNCLLTLAFSTWTLLALSTGLLHLDFDPNSRASLVSVRIGVGLLALAPLVVASVMEASRKLLASISHAAAHDQLTGLPNRAEFHRRTTVLLSRHAGEKRPAALLMLDLDHFKSINDTYGHASGDRVLETVAKVIDASLRQGDICARMGGEEFAVILADCSQATARPIAERLAATIAGTPITMPDGRRIRVTASIGIASTLAPLVDMEPLMKQADDAMYSAKRLGRNRVELSEADAKVATTV